MTDEQLLKFGVIRKSALTPKKGRTAEARRLEALLSARIILAKRIRPIADAIPDKARQAVEAAHEAAKCAPVSPDFWARFASEPSDAVLLDMVAGWIEIAEQVAAEKRALGVAIRHEKDQGKRRLIRIRLATPRWVDFRKIADLVIERNRITRETGVPHHIDHIFPLAGGQWVCGLHVHTNMRIIPAEQNLKKNARMPVAADIDFQ